MTETKLHTQNAILQPHTQTNAPRAPTHRFLTRKEKQNKNTIHNVNDYDADINFEPIYGDYLSAI